MMKIIDGFTSPIQKNIDMMDRMVNVMETMNKSGNLDNLESDFQDIRKDISLASHEMDELNKRIEEVSNAPPEVRDGIGQWESKILNANAALDLFQKGLNAAKSLAGQVTGLLDEADTRNLAQHQLGVVMANQGNSYEDYKNVLSNAARMQGKTTYSTDLFTSAAAELSTYLQTEEALSAMMGTMADYAAGMGGVNLTYQQMVDYATQLGKALDGTYDGLLKKGFVLTDAQKEIIELGTEMERVQVLTDVIGQSWDGLAEALANTPQGVVQSVHNELGAIKADMGQGIYPAVLELFSGIRENMPMIQELAQLAVGALNKLIGFIADPVLPTFLSLLEGAQDVYHFIDDNWTTIEPILWGIGTAVAAITAALLIYKGVVFAISVIEGIKGAAQMLSTGATIAATAAQWGLNAALLASPTTWIIIGIIALIAIIVALTIWLMRLWQNNIDFKVGVINIWNGLLGFFDQVPVFFQGVGYGILDVFSHIKQSTMEILEGLVNGVIDMINSLINTLNMIPGVSIGTIEHVSFGAETAIREEAARQQRAADLETSKSTAAAKSAARDSQLAADEARWRAEAAEKEAALIEEQANTANADAIQSIFNNQASSDPVDVNVGGGTLDKVGEIGTEIDLSNQSLEYMRDIAEMQALDEINTYSTVAYDGISEARLSAQDADLIKSSANQKTTIYYLNYSGGGVNMNNNIQQGEDLDSIKRKLKEETDTEIESGLAGIYAMVGVDQ